MKPMPDLSEVPEWILAMLRYLGSAFPNWKPTPETGVVYFDALQDVEPVLVADAARAYVREGHEFAPSAGQLRQGALALRKSKRAHPPECACSFECINRLPLAERWMAMSGSMRTMLERSEPDLARQLAAAVPPQVRERIGGVRRLLGFTKTTPVASREPSASERLDRFLNPEQTA